MWLLALKSILVASDLDEGSTPALRTGARLAQLAGAELHLLHVIENPTAGIEDRLRENYRSALSDAPEPASVQVILGSPAAAIVQHAAHHDVAVVILGPHRNTGASRPIGSTAARVVRTAPCPCLVAATELRLPLERVVAPIDLSEVADGALSVALTWASALRPPGGEAHLTALHVTADAARTGAEQVVRARVERARTRARGAARVKIDEMVARGADPAEEIVGVAISAPADLLVMGTRGSAGASEDLGSVSTAVARQTPCPLLLVPPASWVEKRTARS